MDVGVGFKAEKNELFISLPEGKSPFMGIVYERLDLYTLQHQFLENEEKELFLYYSEDKINIRLQLSSRNVVQFHSQLSYDRTQLLLWLDSIKNSESIVFGVLVKKDPKPEIIKHPRKNELYFFKVKRLFVVDFKDKVALRMIR